MARRADRKLSADANRFLRNVRRLLEGIERSR
jgi:hypothetical protein